MKPLDLFELLIGVWEGQLESGIYHEEWIRINDNELSGNAFVVKENVKHNTELLRLIKNDTGIFYIADVSHNPAPVSFKLAALSDNVAVFENPLHDFPQKITYTFIDDNNLTAVIEAINDERKKAFRFELTRVK
ncbi:MAG: hypothetical protein HGGPFJEG_01380 [Ignavibacteria bacterium]|nr:hypothetical protein [Ignavibacteria bacterium]